MWIYAGSEEHGEVTECEAVIQKPADDQERFVCLLAAVGSMCSRSKS